MTCACLVKREGNSDKGGQETKGEPVRTDNLSKEINHEMASIVIISYVDVDRSNAREDGFRLEMSCSDRTACPDLVI